MQVRIEQPHINGDTVTFRWQQSEPNPHQIENSFFLRYENLDLSVFSEELFYEVFLSYQLRVFASYVNTVDLIFPTAVPAYTVAFWSAYHQAGNVTVSPIADHGGYDPWIDASRLVEQPRSKAVFFGGGKDSTLATCLLSEIYGPDEVLALQFVGPIRNDPKLERYLEERQEELMLKPAREQLGVATQRVFTNYQAIFRRDAEHVRPHLELYTAGSLPALLVWGVDLCTHGTPWSTMTAEIRPDGSPKFRYAQSRPETSVAQSRHYQATLGQSITVTDVILPFNSLAAHWMLAERYPAALDHIVSCTIGPTDARWCHSCSKCGLFAILSFSTDTYVTDFDYEFFLTRSSVIQRLIDYAESGVEQSVLGNAPWASGFFSAPTGYILGCHMVARIDPENLSIPLSDEARGNLAIWCALYGNQLYPVWESVPRVTLDLLPSDLGQKIGAIVAEHLEIIDHLPTPSYAGNSPTHFIFDPPMQSPVTRLEHVQR